MIDYHLHGDFCGHARGALEEYVAVAISRNFKEIGFSAHLPKVKEPDPFHAMPEEDLPRYVELVGSLRRRYRTRITIRLGIEADYFEGYEEKTRRLLRSHDFDYVLGAVHFIGDWHFTSRAGRARYGKEDPDESYMRYFDLVKRGIRTGLFDILAHPDAIRVKGFAPEATMETEYRAIAGLLAEHGMAVEVNTAGIRRDRGGIYPARPLLEACLDRDVPVTIGSDAHDPEDVGRDYDVALQLFAEMNLTTIATFSRRRISMQPLSRFFPR